MAVTFSGQVSPGGVVCAFRRVWAVSPFPLMVDPRAGWAVVDVDDEVFAVPAFFQLIVVPTATWMAAGAVGKLHAEVAADMSISSVFAATI